MPDHLYLPGPGRDVGWRDHLRAHPSSVTLLGIITACAGALVADSVGDHIILPSLAGVPAWVQLILGGLLLLGVILALAGMTWRPRVTRTRTGRAVIRAETPLAVERLGWVVIIIVSLGMAWAVARTGPWVMATMLPLSWAILSTARAASLTMIARDRRRAPERIAALRIVR